MTADILGLGTATPHRFVRQTATAGFISERAGGDARHARRLRAALRHSGIEHRHSVLLDGDDPADVRSAFYPKPNGQLIACEPGTAARMGRYAREAPALAAKACRNARERAALDAGAITHLVTASCTGFNAPGVDIELMQQLDLNPGVERVHVGFMGCHAAINAMRTAHAIARSDADARVLLCAVELCTLHLQYRNDDDAVLANTLFADGAAAMIVGERGNADAPAINAGWRIAATGSHLLADSLDAMTWTVGDHGFTMTLSPRVPDIIHAQLPAAVDAWLESHGTSRARLGSVAVHPGGPRIVEQVAQALDLPEAWCAPSREVLASHGNMSSPTILFILEQLMRSNAEGPMLMMAFGPGLAAELALLERIQR